MNTTSTFTCPYTVEGARTVAFELWLDGSVPDWVVVPIGAGPLLVAILHGFEELQQLGLTEEVPRMLAVQAAGCAPIVRAVQQGAEHVTAWKDPQTVAGGVADPLTGYEDQGDLTLEALRRCGGSGVTVAEDDILATVLELAHCEGLFQEPSSALAVAAIRIALRQGLISEGDNVVGCLTGTGLHDPTAALAKTTFPTIAVDHGLLSAELALAQRTG
jgi:threonine synthase